MLLLGVLAAQAEAAAPAAAGSYDLLESVTVTGSAQDVQFANVGSTYASTYKHLQIRFTARSARPSNSADALLMRLGTGGTVDSGTNYSGHFLRGNGSSVVVSASTSAQHINVNNNAAASTYTTNAWTTGVIDILDAFNSNKYPTIRCLTGQTSPEASIYISSGSWRNLGTISDIFFTHEVSSPDVGSNYRLYGLKASA